MSAATCPRCGGVRLDAQLRYQHRTDCRIYVADTATIAADHERGAGVRPATAAEAEMLTHEGYAPAEDGLVLGVRFRHSGGLHDRRAVLLDADGRYVADADEPGADA